MNLSELTFLFLDAQISQSFIFKIKLRMERFSPINEYYTDQRKNLETVVY